jgi:plastocyanin
MHRSFVLVLGVACALGLGALALAQDSTPPATPDVAVCASPTAGTPAATAPDATPDACATPGAGAAEVTIQMVDIAFVPNEVTIPADTDIVVHLPNAGTAPHNFSVNDKNNPDVPNLGIDVDAGPGQSATITINAPAGDYYFFCDIPGHEPAGMFGTLRVVEQ